MLFNRAPSLSIRRGVLFGLLAFCTSSMAFDRNALLDEANLLLLARERSIPELALVDEQGEPFSKDSLRGRWHLLFFGFTACPDVCPTTLSDMRRLFRQLEPDVRERLQLVLVTADPARDTPEALRTYLGYYRAGFKGLTGELAQLQALSSTLGLPFVPAPKTLSNYNVSHSSNIAIVDPDGKLRGHIRAPLKLEGLRQALPALVESN